ncbi:FAD-dependent oxidoreductase [Actinoplanes ianthinogenes]|uniref:FAD-dependent oxidoreductase n=1 Tax=Actinoplanes ianthinogenes TaxID=122358 RepID=A0ABM7M8K7_9ACTN|nr:FAD-dependent monooxygenase [Actinoplanes ianthinogenes]BCJ47992.1 FAD-dependent oxidoreductase [Actinoplanes ianthinogenes]GGR05628.1 FAD-dependent oxidoreductase [Actinoplanes ianthinogenes]
MSDRHRPVLIVGGGLTGLSTAVFLAWHGVEATLVERHPGTSEHPKARAINPRTMEVFGAVGMAEAVRAGRSPISGNTDLVHVETLAGHERVRMPSATPEAIDRISPAGWTLIDQNQLEPILRRRAEQVGADVRFGTELTALTQTADGVRATLRERSSGRDYELTADHLVAADGSRSPLRALLGIGHHGPGVITELVSFFFDADLTEALRGRRIIAAYVNNAEVRGTIIPLDNDRRWVMNVSYFPDRGQRAEDFDDERCTAIVRAAVGVPDLPVTIAGGSRPGWDISARVADRMSAGRVLVAGDAAHVMPPTGAFGASTGIQDAYNLAWKLALVHRGVAGPALLDSYDQERRPVAERTVEQAMLRFAIREGKKYEDVADRMVSEETMTFGYCYPRGAFVPEPGTDGALEDPDAPGGRPGARAPHVALGDTSTIDLFGRGFVVLASGADPDWAAAAAGAGSKFGVPVEAHVIDPGVPGFADRYGLRPGGASLIRPDGFVAWRTARRPADPTGALTEALRTVLAV